MKSSLSQSLSLSPFHFGFRGEQVNFSSVMRPCTRRTKNIKSAATIFLNHHQSSSSNSSTLFCNYRHYFAKSRVFGVASSSSSSFSGLDSQLRQMRLSLLYQSHRAQKGKLSRSSTGRKSTLAATFCINHIEHKKANSLAVVRAEKVHSRQRVPRLRRLKTREAFRCIHTCSRRTRLM